MQRQRTISEEEEIEKEGEEKGEKDVTRKMHN
jgi:hypothetical protein